MESNRVVFHGSTHSESPPMFFFKQIPNDKSYDDESTYFRCLHREPGSDFSDWIYGIRTDKSPLNDVTILGLPGLLLVGFSMVHDGLCILFQEAKSVLRIQQRRLPASFAWYLMRGTLNSHR